MDFNKLSGIPEQPAKADKSAPTGIRDIFLKPIIGGVREVLIRARLSEGLDSPRATPPTRRQTPDVAEAPTMWPEYFVNVHKRARTFLHIEPCLNV